MNKHIKLLVLLAVLGSTSGEAFAESFRTELGWGNITPCSRVKSSGNSLFGSWFPDTVETAEQRVYAYAVIEAPTLVSGDLKMFFRRRFENGFLPFFIFFGK